MTDRRPGALRPRPLRIVYLTLLAMLATGCQTSIDPRTPAELTVVKAADIGTLRADPDIVGRDGAYSAIFAGHAVWLYGDSFLARPNAHQRTLISNSWGVADDLGPPGPDLEFSRRGDDESGAPGMILPETAAEQSFNVPTMVIRAGYRPAAHVGRYGPHPS